MEQELGWVGWGGKDYETGFSSSSIRKLEFKPSCELFFSIQGTWELREAEEAAAEPRCGEQGAEEGGQGGEEEEGWIWLWGKLKVKLYPIKSIRKQSKLSCEICDDSTK